MQKGNGISISNTTKGRLPRLPFVDIKNTILGDSYNLSIAVVSPKRSRELNKEYRGKDSSTDILSFSLGGENGEIVLELQSVKKKAALYGKTFEKYLEFLLIHGMLHLKGLSHGSKMESEEMKFQKKFGI